MQNLNTNSELRQRYCDKINSIVNRSWNDTKIDVVIHNYPVIRWAKKRGYVSVQSATQAQWTQKGAERFFNRYNQA